MQVTDELVKYITAELMKRLGSSAPAKPRLRLVGRRDDLSTLALARLQENFEVEDHRDWDDPLPTDAAVLITSLNIQALVRVAEGDEGCTVEGRALLAALLNGQPVAALKEGIVWRRYASTAPKALLARYARYEEVLQSYGLKLVSEDEAANALLGRRAATQAQAATDFRPEQPPKAAAPAKGYGGGRKVLTEADVMRLCPASKGEGQDLRPEPGTVLTPLAQDYIKAMKINVL
ncbi:hypothetical protein C4J81_16690 [Deltaproteobacteria bacterium Smac51]|nr:hypothetical protein C4J81_16690 [Deltaproteobacteria bacterium Smac51]